MAPSNTKKIYLKKMYQQKRNSFTIAIFRALFLGDMLCAIPAIRSIRKNFPCARLSLIGLPWAEDFVSHFPFYIDEFISFSGFLGLPEQHYSKENFNNFLSAMKQRKFDMFIQMHGDGRITNSIVNEIQARCNIGYYNKNKNKPDVNYSLFYPYPSYLSEVEIWNSLIEKIELTSFGDHLEFPVTKKNRTDLKTIMNKFSLENKRYICIHPGARDKNRRWSPKKFAKVADGFYKKGFKIVITGSSTEKKIIQEVTSNMKLPAIILAGKTSLGVLAALLQESHLLLTNDTGVMHLAEAVGATYIVVWTSEESKKWLHHSANNIAIHADQIKNVSQLYNLSLTIQ